MTMKNFQPGLLLFLVILSAIFAASPMPVEAAATLAAPTITNPTLSPGTAPFSINITVANVQNLWGYQFTLDYNTSVLTALDAGSYPPFNSKGAAPSINDTAGFVSLVYYTYMGDKTGFSGSAPVAWIRFAVKNYGTSKLHLHGPSDGSLFSDPSAKPIQHTDMDGIFTNLINIAVTNVTAAPRTVNKTQTVNINVTVQNQGAAAETFNVTTFYGDTPIQTKTVITLASKTSAIIPFTWDTTYVTPNTYTIKAQAQILPGETNTFTDGKVTVIRPAGNPTAVFTYSPTQPLEGQNVTFNASLSTPDGGTITSYAWDFGDHTKLIYTGTNFTSTATHTYTKMGTYSVTLNVTNSQGKWDATQARIIIYRHATSPVNYTPILEATAIILIITILAIAAWFYRRKRRE